MSSSTHNSIFTKTIFTLLFCVLFFAPVVVSKNSISQSTPAKTSENLVSYTITVHPATALAQFQNKPKVDASGSDTWASIVTFAGNLILGIGAFFAYIAGNVLDFSLQSLVFGMGDMINKQGVGIAIDSAWKIIRDICNLAFIFGFIFLGIRTIIDPESSSVKRTLSQIIIGALLINFSLYITKFVIDFSNYTSYVIYTSFVSSGSSISSYMFQIMGVTTFYSGHELNTKVYEGLTGTGSFAFYLAGMILLLIAAFVFFATAIMLVTRFVALVFLMIASPVLFAATVFPKTEATARMLWSKLFSYSFFAPLYLLLTLISLLIMGAFVKTMSGPKTLSAALTGSSASMDSFGVIISFIVVAFFLIQSLLISKKLGVMGGDSMVSLGDKMRRGAQGYVGRGAMRVGGKYSVGATMERVQKNTTSPTVARAAGAVVGAKFGSANSYSDKQKEKHEFDRRKAKQAEVGKISTAVSTNARAQEHYDKVHKNPHATQAEKATAHHDNETAKMAMEQAMSGASTDQILAILEKHPSGPEHEAVVGNLTAGQFDSLMKVDAEKLDDAKKDQLRNARSAAVQKRLIDTENRKRVAAAAVPGAAAAVPATFSNVIGRADAKDLEAIKFDELLKEAGNLSSKQIDGMSLSTTAKSRLSDARKAALIAEFNKGGAGAGAGALFGRITSESERAKLPTDILRDYGSAKFLTQGVLTKMLDNDGVSDSDRSTIKGNIETSWAADLAKTASFTKFFNDTPAGQQYT